MVGTRNHQGGNRALTLKKTQDKYARKPVCGKQGGGVIHDLTKNE